MGVRGRISLGLAVVALVGTIAVLARACVAPRRMEISDGYRFLRRPGEEWPSRKEMGTAAAAARMGAPLADGIRVVRLPARSTGFTWTGGREYELTVLGAPGDILEVVLVVGERPVAREHPEGGAARVEIAFEAPLFGVGRYRLDVRARAGALEPYEFELPGTIHLDLRGIVDRFD